MEGVEGSLVLGLILVEPVVQMFLPRMVITSLKDGVHSEGSLHYKGLAGDIRTFISTPGDVSESTIRNLRDCAAGTLGGEWDVVLEDDHLHIELDP